MICNDSFRSAKVLLFLHIRKQVEQKKKRLQKAASLMKIIADDYYRRLSQIITLDNRGVT